MDILFIKDEDFDVILNLKNITSMQRYKKLIVVHFNNPDESYHIYDTQEEFEILSCYIEFLQKNSLNESVNLLPENEQ